MAVFDTENNRANATLSISSVSRQTVIAAVQSLGTLDRIEYLWGDWPVPTLYGNGLPVTPFAFPLRQKI